MPNMSAPAPQPVPVKKPLTRSTLEAYVGIIGGVGYSAWTALGNPINFWVGLGLWGVVAFCAADLIWNSTFTIRRGPRLQGALSLILGVVTVLFVYRGWANTHPEPLEKPYCYAIFYRSMGPDGSVVGGKEVLGLVEELRDSPATNVTVTIQDWTGHPVGDFNPKTVRSDFLSVVYPYFTGVHSPCRFTPTHIIYDASELGKEYWVTISVGNGEETEERIKFTKEGQCISFMRVKDQKVYVNNYLSPFDPFGGCLMSEPEMAKDPKSGAEWKSACPAD